MIITMIKILKNKKKKGVQKMNVTIIAAISVDRKL